MTPEQRESLIEQVGRDRIVWAGLVGELEGKYAVNMFLADGGPGERTIRAAGVEVHILHDGIENCGWLATEGKFQGLLTLPGANGTLVGPEAATLVAERLNQGIRDVNALKASVVKYARVLAGICQNPQMIARPMAFMALRARAMAGYVNQHNRLPTQPEFENFVAQRGDPWAIALRSPRHNRNHLNAETLQLQLIPEPAGRFADPYPQPTVLASWVRPGLPLLGMPAPQARQAEENVPGVVPQAAVERRPIRLEDLPPQPVEFISGLARFAFLPKPDSKHDPRDHRTFFPGLGS